MDAANPYEGSVETTSYTEKELEPLRILVFDMARVRAQIVSIERRKDELAHQYHDYVREVCLEAEGIFYQAQPIAQGLGQLDEFHNSIREKLGSARDHYAEQIFAFFSAVDLLLFSNGLVRSVSPPQEDTAEELWQRTLEEHRAKHGVTPAPLDVCKVKIFTDSVEAILFKSGQDRLHALNDTVSTLAWTTAIVNRKRFASAPASSLFKDLRGG